MSRIAPRTLKGFRDLLPARALVRSRFLALVEATFLRHGYVPIDTPALEHLDVLRGKGGQQSDQELFSFADRGGRDVALRFDLTVPLARFVAQHEGELVFPFRRYHAGTCWRGERPQRGRAREFLQCDADLVGASGSVADAEILLVLADAYAALDVGPVRLRINDRRVLNGLLERQGALELAAPVLRALDKRERQGVGVVRDEIAALGLAASLADELIRATEPLDHDDATLSALERAVKGSATGEEGVQALREVRALLLAGGVAAERVQLDPSIARGLDYYTGIVFEARHEEAQDIGSVGSGGRYDDLAGLFTSSRLPGVGCSVGLTRLMDALEGLGRLDERQTSLDVLVVHPDPEQLPAAFALLAALRREGLSAALFPEARRHAAQMRYADRLGVGAVVTLDADGFLHAKRLADGSAAQLPANARILADWLARATPPGSVRRR